MTAAADAESIFSRCAPAVGEVARAARAALLTKLPGVDEQPDAAANVVGYGYGPGYKGLVCTLILSKGGVKLGFYKGAALPDPHGLLEGTGKVHRYVVLNNVEAVADPKLAALIDDAAAAYRERQGGR
jgi:hypothetical protein